MNGLHRLETAFGPVQVAFDLDGAVIYLGFVDHEFRNALLAKVQKLRPVAKPAAGVLDRLMQQLGDYAAGGRRSFAVPFKLYGTPFEQQVWAGLQRIPYGERRSYGQLAAELGDPNLARAVGRANGANPISILVPCHRVIGANGTLTGYAGGLPRKEQLLRLEGADRLAIRGFRAARLHVAPR